MTPLKNRKSPVGSGAISKEHRMGTTPSILAETSPISSVLAEAGNDLSRIHPRARAVFDDGYISGHRDGYRVGYAARAADEVAEWAPVRDHLAAYVRSFHGLGQRRAERPARRPQTPEQILQQAHHSWGLPWNGGDRHVA